MTTEITFKVVVAGPFNAGKTTLISAISDSEVVSTEAMTSGTEAAVKAATTVALDFGKLSVSGDGLTANLHMFGTPGQARFSFMLSVLGADADGWLLAVDGSDPETWGDAARFWAAIPRGAPAVVALNRTHNEAVAERFAAFLGPDWEVPIVPCHLTDPDDVIEVMGVLLMQLLESSEPEAELSTGAPW